MKLLMTADAVGGVWQYATDLACGLRAHGIETAIALLGPARPAGDAPDGVTVIETGLPLDWLAADAEAVLAAGDAVARLADEIGATHVHLNTPALAARARFGVPVVAVEHGQLATWWAAARDHPIPADMAWQRELTAAGLRRADAAVAPTAAHAAAVQSAYALPGMPVAIHDGRRAPAVTPARAPAAHAFTAGRLWDEVKRTALLDRVAALTPVRAAGPLQGPHGECVAIRHLDRAGTLGADALAAELAGRPVFLSAAIFEPFGLAVLEAAQAGCPLVLADIATFRELWDGAASFVAGDDPASWVAAIEAARADRAKQGRRAAERARRYTVEACAAAHARLYAGLSQRAAA